MDRLKELGDKIDGSLGLEARVARLEVQMGRVVSDMESEKDTRTRANERLDNRIVEVERTIWKASGVVMGVLFVAEVLLRFLIK